MLITRVRGQIVPPAPPSAELASDGVYLIVGGLGGLGKSIVRWLGSCGARRIVTVSRSGACDENGVALIREMQSRGVEVEVKRCDITSLEEVKVLMESIEQGARPSVVRGVIHSAMVVQVRTISNGNGERGEHDRLGIADVACVNRNRMPCSHK